MRASRGDARNVLANALSRGEIFAFEDFGGAGPRWKIEVVPTRLAHYHDPEARGVIVLTTREVLVFGEGLWAARHAADPELRPTRRVGS